MQRLNLEQNTEEWLEWRKGKITGSKLGDIYSSRGTRKIGFYELIADQLSVGSDGEEARARGHRLEPEAIEMFEAASGLKVSTGGVWVSDIDERIALSPDGYIEAEIITHAVEVKCLSGARHIEAIVENKVPKEYECQAIQYFVVNPELQKLYFVLYDDRIAARPLHIIEVTRESLGSKPDDFLKFQLGELAQIDEIVERLSF